MINNLEEALIFAKDFDEKLLKNNMKVSETLLKYGYSDLYAIIGLFSNIDEKKLNYIKENKVLNVGVIEALEIMQTNDNHTISTNKFARTVSFVKEYVFLEKRIDYDKLPEDINIHIQKANDCLNMEFIKRPDLIKWMKYILERYKGRLQRERKFEEGQQHIKKLCSQYGFSEPREVNGCYFISSKYDEWRFEYTIDSQNIKLYHRNKKYSLDDYHFQKTFTGGEAINTAISYMFKHDNYLMNYKYNYDILRHLLKRARKHA
jgi:hypothetical protein